MNLETLKEEQRRLASRARFTPLGRTVKKVAGADVAYPEKARARAAVVLLSWPELKPLEEVVVEGPVNFPYIPGYLSFREVPALLAAFEKLSSPPDLVFVDGQGLAHPRGCGLAVHLGVSLGLPTLGCAKKPLIKDFDPPGDEFGARSPIWLEGRVVGYAVRTRVGVKPVYVSPGHLLTPEEAVEYVLAAVRGFRLPEPLRQAHRLSVEAGRG
ncbi:endonuclease V [Thermosulfurimonas marina]|uniref:Endonuclease V n=1 Tax=Thermosulfurimonas marina TaxID=2047767 RepID=A0A6H1WSZ3_9BACT|nr:endonuclease V [Thermosulfurimonas marina]QJA06337.1 endonuclease V [Thermosulfurimonas marina]